MIHIRRVRESDAPALREVLDVICRERRYLGKLEVLPIDSFQGFIASVVKAGFPYFIAEMNGKIVGWCSALPGESSAGAAHIARLAMGLLKDFRGRKIGLDLAKAAIEKARELGSKKIELTVYSSNEPAISLYQKIGFEEEGRKKRGRLVDGIYDDVVLMALDLEEPHPVLQTGSGSVWSPPNVVGQTVAATAEAPPANMSDSYEGLPAESWNIFGGNEPELDFWFLKQKLLQAGGLCLDLACGSGKHLVPYLKAGMAIHGVDSSRTMLDNCRLRLDEEKLSTELYCQQMQSLELPFEYKAVFVSVGSFCVLTSIASATETLSRCYDQLQKGGQLYVTLFMPVEANDQNHRSRIKLGPKPFGLDAFVEIERWTESVDYLDQVVVQKRRYVVRKDGQIVRSEEYLSAMRWYGKHEFTLMLERAGFVDVQCFGGFTGTPPRDWKEMIVFRGTKKR